VADIQTSQFLTDALRITRGGLKKKVKETQGGYTGRRRRTNYLSQKKGGKGEKSRDNKTLERGWKKTQGSCPTGEKGNQKEGEPKSYSSRAERKRWSGISAKKVA